MLRQLKIKDFRNLGEVRVDVPEGARVVALVGPNGAGKTSVLEAVSLLGGGRGLLGAEARAQVRTGARGWTVWAETLDGQAVAAGFSGGQKKTLVDDRAATAGQMAAVLPVVWLAPRLDRLFFEGPADRREWLDDQALVASPAHGEVVGRYAQHKRGRLRLLREGRVSGDWIEAEERMMAEAGVALLRGRLAYLDRLNAVAEGVALALEGGALEILDEADPIAALQGKFARSREIDARLERTHAGPDTLDVGGVLTTEEGEVALARVSSGQHKRALVRLVVAQARLVSALGRAPVVIVDELGAHLDMARRMAVLEDLTGLGCQVWVSDTELPAGLPDGVTVKAVAGGTVGADGRW